MNEKKLDKYFDALIEISKAKRNYFDNYMVFAKRIKEIAERILKDAEVFIFGSILEGKTKATSDIDVLIVSDNLTLKKRWELLGEINGELGEFHPFEIHLTDSEGFKWYEKFAKKMIRV